MFYIYFFIISIINFFLIGRAVNALRLLDFTVKKKKIEKNNYMIKALTNATI